jgi:hypothetical protein
MKPEETRGLNEGEPDEPPMPGFIRKPDEHHYRLGWAVPEDLGVRILETTEAAKRVLSKTRAERRVPTTMQELRDAVQLMKGGIMMAYPAYHGLPDWEPCVVLFENPNIEEVLRGETIFDLASTKLWFAGKEVQRNKLLREFIKGPEKTKIIAKLAKGASGAPVREPVVDRETQSQMLAWYHKKQEEAKKMQAESEDDYLNSPWADPRSLKRQLHGTNTINWRG